MEDHQAKINKLVEEGPVFLTDLINDRSLIEARWMVVEGCDTVGPSKTAQTQAAAYPPPSLLNNNEGEKNRERNGEEVNIVGDSKTSEWEVDPRGARPGLYLLFGIFMLFWY